MKKILIIGLLFLLPSCALFDKAKQFETSVTTTIQNVITPDNFDNVTIAYAALSSAGDGYYSLCERKAINKSCWKTIAYLQPYEQKAYDSYMALNEFVKRNPNGDASSLFKIAKDAFATLQSLQVKYGVK